jgi:hypothetical protein
MPANKILHTPLLLPDLETGKSLALLSADELKVLLYLTLIKRARPAIPLKIGADKSDLPMHRIPMDTQPSKKQVRVALRFLSISAT